MKRFGNLCLLLLVVVCGEVKAADINNGSNIADDINNGSNIFDLVKYGGTSSYGGGFDKNSKALMSAWEAACNWAGTEGNPGTVNIPSGDTFLTGPVVLNGPCSGPVVFRNQGKLMAPPGPMNGVDEWISFRYVNGLTINGGGYFDGQGRTVWGRNIVHSDIALLDLSFVTNSRIESIQLTNSKKTHLHLYACNSINLEKVSISSPANSPNTDGIKIAVSTNINIIDSNIASGDDCVAMLTGSKNITITGVACGPGHGVSIGSMGGSPNEKVIDIRVNNVNFTDTLNGVRIKTWASVNPGLVSAVSFKDILMKDVYNPIIIDQNYCPPRNCGKLGNSHVQIQDVKFINIKGTSKNKVALKLHCSRTNPCTDILLQNIDLKYQGPTAKGLATADCSNIYGTSLGLQIPASCF